MRKISLLLVIILIMGLGLNGRATPRDNMKKLFGIDWLSTYGNFMAHFPNKDQLVVVEQKVAYKVSFRRACVR